LEESTLSSRVFLGLGVLEESTLSSRVLNMETRRVYVLFYTLLQECQGVAMNGQDGRLDSESTYSWDSRFVFRQNVQRYSTLMPSFQIKYCGSVINLFKQNVQ
jgi:hypothetical protein